MSSKWTMSFSTFLLVALWSWSGQAADRHLGDLDGFVGIVVQDGQAFLQDGSERERVALDVTSVPNPNRQSSGEQTTPVPMPISASERLSIIWESAGKSVAYVTLNAALITACMFSSVGC